MSPTLALTLDLIRRPSVTPVDADCQEQMIRRLEAIGFRIERLRFGDVDNFWARRGDEAPVLAFAGPWMLQTLVDYLQRTLQSIPGAVG